MLCVKDLTVMVVLVAALTSGSLIEQQTSKICAVEGQRLANSSEENDRLCKAALDARHITLDYFVGLGRWKNGDSTLAETLFPRFAPCARQSDDLSGQWHKLFQQRKAHDVSFLKAQAQVWNRDTGSFKISHGPLKFDVRLLEAAELLLQRRPPSDIGESYGRYHTSIHAKTEGSRGVEIHSGVQASCSSSRGDVMLLDLRAAPMKRLLNSGSNVINMVVAVQTRRQYHGARSATGDDRQPIVIQAVGIVLHYRHEGGTSPHLLKAAAVVTNSHGARNGDHHGLSRLSNARERRSLTRWSSLSTRPPPTMSQTENSCRRVLQRMSLELYEELRVISPSHSHSHFDIGKCVGYCSFPLDYTQDATNHIIASHQASPGDSSACCSPIEYKDLYVTTYDAALEAEGENPFGQLNLRNIRAISCGCA